MPQVDVAQRDDRLVVRADLPGLGLDDIQVAILDNALVIEGERRAESEEDEGDIYRAERVYGRFRRVIPLPRGTTAEDAEARFVNGVLEVSLRLPKQPEERGERIQVQGGEEQQQQGAQPQGKTTH
jgi:HSP20 family protein